MSNAQKRVRIHSGVEEICVLGRTDGRTCHPHKGVLPLNKGRER
jgi:hypothetical protein